MLDIKHFEFTYTFRIMYIRCPDTSLFLNFLKKYLTRSNIKMQCYYRKATVHMIMTHASSFDRLPLEMISLGWTKGNI